MKLPFSPRIYQALTDAMDAHAGQTRKGNSKIPYIVHPIQVAIAVSQFTEDEDVVIAALFHDTLEDTPMDPHHILSNYGSKVLALVCSVSEEKDHTMSKEMKEKTWHIRKSQMIQRIYESSMETQLIAMADDLSNLTDMVEGLTSSQVSSLSFHVPLEKRAGLHRYRFNYLWKNSKIVVQCSLWLSEYQKLLQKLEEILNIHGKKIISFTPELLSEK